MFPGILDFWGVKQVTQVNHNVSRDLGFLGGNQVDHNVSLDFGFFGGEPGEPCES